MKAEELKICDIVRAFNEGKTVNVDFTWNFHQGEDRKIRGACGDECCCSWEFDSIEDFLKEFRLKDISIYD